MDLLDIFHIAELATDAARNLVATILVVLGLAGLIGGGFLMVRSEVVALDILGIALTVVGGILLILGIIKYFSDR